VLGALKRRPRARSASFLVGGDLRVACLGAGRGRKRETGGQSREGRERGGVGRRRGRDRTMEALRPPAKNRARLGASGTLAVLRSPNGPELDWRRRAVAPASDPLWPPFPTPRSALPMAWHASRRTPRSVAPRTRLFRFFFCSVTLTAADRRGATQPAPAWAGNASGSTSLGHVSRETATPNSGCAVPCHVGRKPFHVKHCSTATSGRASGSPPRLHFSASSLTRRVPGLQARRTQFPDGLPALPPT
jgi:hypothetical protein